VKFRLLPFPRCQIGSGPGWTVTYLYPFSQRELGVSWAWDLSYWQNLVATLAFLAISVVTAVTLRRSFVESFAPASLDAVFCNLIGRWWVCLRSIGLGVRE